MSGCRAKLRIGAAVTLLLVVAVFCGVLGYLEIQHRYNFGHYFTYGLHLDVSGYSQNIGIPGQTHMYQGELSNFTLFPATLIGCEYESDVMQPGTAYPYLVQRWNGATDTWETIVNAASDDFCEPILLSRGNTKRVNHMLWPGFSINAVEPEATGAREPFERGDLARFVIVTNFVEGRAVETVSSPPFRIEDNVVRDDVQYRIQH